MRHLRNEVAAVDDLGRGSLQGEQQESLRSSHQHGKWIVLYLGCDAVAGAGDAFRHRKLSRLRVAAKRVGEQHLNRVLKGEQQG